MRVHSTAVAIAVGLAGLSMSSAVQVAVAAAGVDPLQVLNSIPAPPANVAAAASATQVAASGALLAAPAYDAVQSHITEALKPTGSVGGMDLARASSDPAYAAQVQARMQSMSTAEKMAMANEMMASQRAAAGAPGGTAAVAAFMGTQRGADMAAQQRIRALLDGALASSGAKHRAIDDALNAAAKSCPQDKTGWPLESCTAALGVKAIAQHRAVEDAALGSEGQAFIQARAIALAELNKGRDVLAHATGPSATSLAAWAMTYVQLLNDYGKAITLRAGFWAHAGSSKYTGQVTSYIRAAGGEISWPLKDGAYGAAMAVGL